ncbi:MAG: DNA translocase FtsK [Isosphaeraceae bacterium]
MLDRQRLARCAPALAGLLATLFLALSLAGYDPSDPPGSSVSPANNPVSNPCGPVGATLAHLVFLIVGWGGLLLLAGLAAINVHLFGRRVVPEPAVRLSGFGLTLVVASALLQRYAPGLRPAHPVGSGGYVGALVASFLEGQFGVAGLILILGASGFLGLVFCHDVLLLWPAHEFMAVISRLRGAAPPADALNQGGIPGGLVVTEPSFAVLGTSTLPPPPILTAPSRPRSDAPAALPPVNPIHRSTAAAPPATLASGPTAIPTAPANGSYVLPPAEMLEPPPTFPVHEHEAKIHARAMLLERTLAEFDYQVRVVQIDTGPVITQFEIELEAGLRVSKIVSLADDLAIALAVPSVRIVAPIPGKTTVGIEVPNERRAMVKLGEIMPTVAEQPSRMMIPLFLGKDVKGAPLAFDLAKMPHLLIAGRTGTGKSVCLNAMILSILMTKRPDEVKLILVDPKMVELSQFKRIPHLMHPVVTDMKKAESLLSWACDKMDERYAFLARAGVRNIESYNQLGADEIFTRLRPEDEQERARIPTYMPYIVIIIDEMSDLIMTSPKEVESHIVRLAQKARAVGMHLIVATQKPTVDVITGLIKGNLPARIAFQVSSRGDSRVVLDEMGAERLLGNGDMLFLFPGTSHIVRAQGTYVSDAEVNRVCHYLEQYPVEFSRELVQMQVGGSAAGKERGGLKERDELYEAAIEVIIREGRGSTSLLQRALGIGYGRAARLIDYMAEDGIVGEFKSGSAREVLYTWDEWEALKKGDSPGAAA